MSDTPNDAEAGRSSADTVVPKGILPGSVGATVIVAWGQLFEDESLREAFAVGGPAMAVGSTAWRWFFPRLERAFLFRRTLRRIDVWLNDPDTSEEEKKKLQRQRAELRTAYVRRAQRRIDTDNGPKNH